MSADGATRNLEAVAVRRAIRASTANLDGAPEPRYVYVVPGHVKALRPEHPLVVGMRGAGKSVWAAALQKDAVLAELRIVAPNWPRNLKATAGFTDVSRDRDCPDADTIAAILAAGLRPRALWRAVIAAQTWMRNELPELAVASWLDRTRWVSDHPEDVSRFFAEYDRWCAERDAGHVVLFDALDRTSAGDWARMRLLLRELLQVVLDFRPYRALRLKLFVRPDMIGDPQVTAFPDASKVVGDAIELAWGMRDLYGLLWRRLANVPDSGGESFRAACVELGSGPWVPAEGAWLVPERLASDVATQRDLFELLAARWMGASRKRGRAYTWLPRHLGDASGRTSPRSFLQAIHVAAEETQAHEEWALSVPGIRAGVQAASRRRVTEIGEDHPWVPVAMEALHNLLVPCELDEIERLWQQADVLALVRRAAAERLPPAHIEDGLVGLAKDLVDLGVLQRLADGRVNVPDVFRVAFGLRRKGGVPPLQR